MKCLKIVSVIILISSSLAHATDYYPVHVDLGPGYCTLNRALIERTKEAVLKTQELHQVTRGLEEKGYLCDQDKMIGHGIRGPWIFKNTLKLFCRQNDKTAMVYMKMKGDFSDCRLYLRLISVSEY